MIVLVRFCPQLTQLMLDVDTENTDNIVPGQRPGAGYVNTALKWIRLGPLPPGKIAAFLSDLLPNLREIDDSGWTPEVEEAWMHVDELLPTLAAVRAQERSSLHLEAEPKRRRARQYPTLCPTPSLNKLSNRNAYGHINVDDAGGYRRMREAKHVL
ncbi:hypothetical protein SCP_1302090 [Sparassis crispa]|uniref:Uncharacterized protein n=1 Tax=Sparassis crispa TaxID=139825 RepID=A0A401H1U8_9APHY|nr:hypothetical protein SCP_1302090 [Sparassis crispa]GBE88394.1 hypothetical protein SCP_1302090 [Sparassis crispa]